jgi:hypothetical protein
MVIEVSAVIQAELGSSSTVMARIESSTKP